MQTINAIPGSLETDAPALRRGALIVYQFCSSSSSPFNALRSSGDSLFCSGTCNCLQRVLCMAVCCSVRGVNVGGLPHHRSRQFGQIDSRGKLLGAEAAGQLASISRR